MRIFDAHCDVLYKMFLDRSISFFDSEQLQVNYQSLQSSNTKVQLFAIYIPENLHPDLRFQAALEMVEIFYEKVIKPYPLMKAVQSKEDIAQLKQDEVGAILTLEGCEAIDTDLLKLKTFIRLGVTSVGLTWNYANSVADGALEQRGAGLTQFGKEVVSTLNEQSILCDVSHLSEQGFWDVLEIATYPFASHSNAYKLCPHPRNLHDEQIRALMERDSVIGITFVPEFLSGKQTASLTDVLHHLDYILSLGAENHVGFGSDFDGTTHLVTDLQAQKDYHNLVNLLHKNYSSALVEKFLYENMSRRLAK